MLIMKDMQPRSRRQENQLQTWLIVSRQAEPIDINETVICPASRTDYSQERLLQMLTDPEAYSSRESLRVLIEEIKQTNPQEVERNTFVNIGPCGSCIGNKRCKSDKPIGLKLY